MRIGALVIIAASVAVVALAWPLQAERVSLLDRARAAIGDGPVVHAVLRGEWGGTLVDLRSGTRSAVHGETEVWYDTARERVHSVTRLGSVVQDEQLYQARQPPADLAALGRRYKEALESGTARISGEEVVDGEPVVWVTVHSELLPDVADGRDHEWAQQIAVSRRTFKPVALRETRDGEPGQGTIRRVLKLELLPVGAGDFETAKTRPAEGRLFKKSRESITVDEARAALGRTPVWLGHEHAGLALARVFHETTSSGRRDEVRLTGTTAAAANECAMLRGKKAGDCYRALSRTRGVHPIIVRADGVFTETGPIDWTDEQTAVVLFYGTVGDDPNTHKEDAVPLLDQPHVTVTQTTQSSVFRPGVGRYAPPPGAVFVAAGQRVGIVRIDGIHVTIEAAGEQAILAAARALVPMPD